MASTNVPLSCENPGKRGEETPVKVEMEDFHIVGFGLESNLKVLPSM